MNEPYEQPTEAQELANAAYVWRKQVQADMLEKLRSTDIKLEDAMWWWERFRRAYEREMETQQAAKKRP